MDRDPIDPDRLVERRARRRVDRYRSANPSGLANHRV
jgi:hypothetical protein